MRFQQSTLNCNGKLVSLDKPAVMGILNATPDSFFDGGRFDTETAWLKQAEKMLAEGATFIDVGAMSSRPGATEVAEKEELRRVLPVVESILRRFPEALISIDTWRSKVAVECVAAGACMVNDISAGRFDEGLFETVASLGTPYVLMHMQGTPADMQVQPSYENVVLEVLDFFIANAGKLRALGVKDILLDPGFGFGKTVEHNYRLLANLHVFSILECPLLVGISRKSMICTPLKISPDKALNGTTAMHVIALQQGAKILRAHDVREACEAIQLWELADHYAENRNEFFR
jgi:dihydropteroate synthase